MRDGVSLNDIRKEKATIHFDRLMKLPSLQAYLKVPGDYPVARIKFKIVDLPKVAEGFLPKPREEKLSLKGVSPHKHHKPEHDDLDDKGENVPLEKAV